MTSNLNLVKQKSKQQSEAPAEQEEDLRTNRVVSDISFEVTSQIEREVSPRLDKSPDQNSSRWLSNKPKEDEPKSKHANPKLSAFDLFDGS
jgi:hypothetical protein